MESEYQRKYPVVPTPELIRKLKPYWKRVQDARDKLGTTLAVIHLEASAEATVELGQDVDIEVFMCDGDFVGFGEASRRMRLIQAEELEDA